MGAYTRACACVRVCSASGSMSRAYRESYAQDSGNLYSYSNKTFGAWEFTITDESTARLKSISIKKDFEVSDILEQKEIHLERCVASSRFDLNTSSIIYK